MMNKEDREMYREDKDTRKEIGKGIIEDAKEVKKAIVEDDRGDKKEAKADYRDLKKDVKEEIRDENKAEKEYLKDTEQLFSFDLILEVARQYRWATFYVRAFVFRANDLDTGADVLSL